MDDTSTSSAGVDGGVGGGAAAGSFPFSDFFDYSDHEDIKCSVGFMELLGINNYNDEFIKDHSSEVLNPPATPNSSSVSSAATGDHDSRQQQQEQQLHKPSKQLKVKKRKGKREKEARFAFMTKSEVDHLEDGYRWRKYGQKAVKNSPFPRSYYRCTSAACNVKKRVERSFADPTIVVTTYEGQHTHPSPILTRSTLALAVPPPPSTGVLGGGCVGVVAMPWLKAINDAHGDNNLPAMSHQFYQTPSFFTSDQLNDDYNRRNRIGTANMAGFLPDKRICNRNRIGTANVAGFLPDKRICNPNSAFLVDHGLLQDVVPPHMLKQE